jgi:hypothetical protein
VRRAVRIFGGKGAALLISFSLTLEVMAHVCLTGTLRLVAAFSGCRMAMKLGSEEQVHMEIHASCCRVAVALQCRCPFCHVGNGM